MTGVIILHGLFLVHCALTKDVGTLKAQTCEILTHQVAGHTYQAGDGTNFTDLPVSTNLYVTLPASSNKNPDSSSLETRVLVLNSAAVNVNSGTATMRIVVPMPDDIFGANRLLVFQEDLLNKTDSSVLSSPANNQQVTVAETVVFSYNGASAFSLMDGQSKIVGSTNAGSLNLLALYAWPGKQTSCAGVSMHPPLNDLLTVISTNAHPTLQLMGLSSAATIDDSGTTALGIPKTVLRPPCLQYINAALKKASKARKKLKVTTATQTGCSPLIVF